MFFKFPSFIFFPFILKHQIFKKLYTYIFCPLVSAQEFNYTSMGGEIEIEGVDDRADMTETRRTFNLLGIKNRLTYNLYI